MKNKWFNWIEFFFCVKRISAESCISCYAGNKFIWKVWCISFVTQIWTKRRGFSSLLERATWNIYPTSYLLSANITIFYPSIISIIISHTQTLKNLKCISVASARSLLSNQLSIKATSNALFIFPHVPHIPFLNENTYDAEHYLLVASCLKLMSFYMFLLKRGMVSRTRWYLKELWCSQTFNVDLCNKTFNLKENRFKNV